MVISCSLEDDMVLVVVSWSLEEDEVPGDPSSLEDEELLVVVS